HLAREYAQTKYLQHHCRQECLHYTSLLVNILHRHIVVSLCRRGELSLCRRVVVVQPVTPSPVVRCSLFVVRCLSYFTIQLSARPTVAALCPLFIIHSSLFIPRRDKPAGSHPCPL
ncbi:MAG: hypothetical protein M0Z50_13960, partial [Planctomycetia bacterium]|nr:hypothetical protein [Planctomycetia bacterium]